MEMSCFVDADFGRPTLVARRNSSSVDSGISEKSISSSGICFALFAVRLPRTDDPDFARAIFGFSPRIDGQQDSPFDGFAKSLSTALNMRMVDVFPIKSLLIGKD